MDYKKMAAWRIRKKFAVKFFMEKKIYTYWNKIIHGIQQKIVNKQNMTEQQSVNMSDEYLGNNSIAELLLSHLGPRRHDTPVVIILLVIYSLIFISGIVGNICTCIVIVKNNYMQTTTNYYLFSLAISDVLTLIFGK